MGWLRIKSRNDTHTQEYLGSSKYGFDHMKQRKEGKNKIGRETENVKNVHDQIINTQYQRLLLISSNNNLESKK